MKRCYDLCKSNHVCFTSDQKDCIRDMVINRTFAIRPVVNYIIREYENVDLVTKELLELVLADIEELEKWCRTL